MGIEYVLDASALCAFALNEPGAESVASLMPASGISAVNLSEVYEVLIRRHVPRQRIPGIFSELGIAVIPFDESLAFECANLSPATRPWGLSLGDRACLATAWQLKATAVTCDGAWSRIDIGVAVRTIR